MTPTTLTALSQLPKTPCRGYSGLALEAALELHRKELGEPGRVYEWTPRVGLVMLFVEIVREE